ncbi:hypothetical protein Peur_041258 [Populus x canadensis]|jgi:hypothetical protein|uniref:Uncharacterized protein n=1 Tax=Populus deltoides TaxID=3696 RepID=A0A8T2ZZ02_POPDE|nr:hypothetical protein H0E87_003422 [Populus deltoides]
MESVKDPERKSCKDPAMLQKHRNEELTTDAFEESSNNFEVQVQMQESQSFILIPLDMKPQRRSCSAKGVAWPNQWASTETKHSERKKKKRKLQEVKNES